MDMLWDGIKFGLALSILVGPILFALIQTSIEQGFRAGWMVGLGIWISDALFVVITYFSISLVAAVSNWDGLEFWLGIVGGIILLAFGIGSWLSKPPDVKQMTKKAVRHSSYITLWLKGFIINTVNPFTFFFWLGVSGLLFTEKELQPGEASYFYGGLIGTLVVADTTKVALAKMIRRWLKPNFIVLLRRIVGVLFMVFGVVLLVRASGFPVGF